MVEDYVRNGAQQLGETTLGSLRHAMALNDTAHINQILADVGAMQSVKLIQIIDIQGEVQAASIPSIVGSIEHQSSLGCEECHRYPSETRPLTAQLTASSDTLRISTPILNEPHCTVCHPGEGTHLGVLLLDVSLLDLEAHMLEDLRIDLGISILSTFLVTTAVYILVHSLVVKRVLSFRLPLTRFAGGDFSARLPSPNVPADELDELAETINSMAGDLETHLRFEEERTQVRQRAIVEERERIARELHDGMAQVLGYVNTKSMAARLLLADKKGNEAESQLLQLEDASRALFVDVREAILGLKMAGNIGDGLPTTIRDFTKQFNRLTAIPVSLDIDPCAERIQLTSENELQLLRIMQEALTNIRKHARAENTNVSLSMEDHALCLTVEDDGDGFDYERVAADESVHFGLSTMRERAATIGAQFDLQSEPGKGTKVSIILPLKGD